MVAEIVNLPPSMRICFGSMLVFMVLPPKAPVHHFLVELLERYRDCIRGVVPLGDGFMVEDAFLGTTYPMFLEIILDVEDLRGLHNVLLCKQSPAIIGACFMCSVRGMKYVHYLTHPKWLPRVTVLVT